MDLERFKELTKGVGGTLPVMRPDGKGGFVEVASVRVVEDFEFDDQGDGPAVVLDGDDDNG